MNPREGAGPAHEPSAPVVGGGRLDRHLADAHLVADVDLADIREASNEPAAARGTTTVTSVPSSRSDGTVEVVEVDVRDESGVDASELVRVERYAPPEVPHPRAQDGVGQQADPVQLDQDGRVPDVEKPTATFRRCHG